MFKEFFFVAVSAVLALNCSANGLIPNSDLEESDGNGWAEGWPRTAFMSYEQEGANHFLRMNALSPNKMHMLYREIKVPAGAEALELTWRHRISNLKKGEKSWFDARIMLEFMDGNRKGLPAKPKAPSFGKNVAEWTECKTQFLVPKDAKILKLMPALFNVESGTWDIDDMQIKPISANELKAAEAKHKEQYNKAKAAESEKIRNKAAQTLANGGSLIANGSFEELREDGMGAKHWGSNNENTFVASEAGNHFMRITAKPNKLVNIYREYPIPTGAKALELSWRQRVTGLKTGEKPWFDARFIFELKDASRNKIAGAPGPAYTQKDTSGWVTKSTRFLVPDNATYFVFMPCLFEAKAGTFDIDDLVLKPIDPAPIIAEKKKWERIEAMRKIPVEQPNKAKWPAELKVVGNKVIDANGKEVWLQGVNVVGLESLPFGSQMMKSTQVAVDEWGSNCIRLTVKEQFWFGESIHQKDGGAAYRKLIDDIITFTANRGAYVVLDLHHFRAPRERDIRFWSAAAKVYANHPAVLFDIFNEPHDISWEVWRNGGFVGKKGKVDESAFLSEEEKKKNQGFESCGMQRLVEVVRSTGARNIIIAGGCHWANDLSGVVNGYALEDKTGNGIMYSWHTYNWHGGWERILPVLEKYPVYLGEFGGDTKKMGFLPLDIQEDPYTFCPDMLGFVQKNKIHWGAFSLAPNSTPRLVLDWEYTPTPFWGEFVIRALKGEQFEIKRIR